MLEFKIVKPEGVVYEADIEKVTIPTKAGEITVYENHAPLVSVLDTGELLITKEGNTVAIAVSGGFFEMRPDNKLYIMADSAERADEIDISRAEQAKKRAEEQLKKIQNVSDVDFARVQAMIDKELNRLHVGNKYKNLKV